MSTINRFFDRFVIPSENYSLSASYGLLWVTSLCTLFWYTRTVGTQVSFGGAAYAMLVIVSFIGTLLTSSPRQFEIFDKFFNFLQFVYPFFVVSLLALEVSEKYKLFDWLRYAFMGLNLQLVCFHKKNKEMWNICLFMTDAAVFLIFGANGNWDGVFAMALHFAINYLVAKRTTRSPEYHSTQFMEVYNLGSSLFCYVTYRALGKIQGMRALKAIE